MGCLMMVFFVFGCGGCDEGGVVKNNIFCCVDGKCGENYVIEQFDYGMCDSVCADDQICCEGCCCNVCEFDVDCLFGEYCGLGCYCEVVVEIICIVDFECLLCDCEDGMCVVEECCQDDSECLGGCVCNFEGNCVVLCVYDFGCVFGEVCQEGFCVVSGLCDKDVDCGDGGVCVDVFSVLNIVYYFFFDLV